MSSCNQSLFINGPAPLNQKSKSTSSTIQNRISTKHGKTSQIKMGGLDFDGVLPDKSEPKGIRRFNDILENDSFM